MTSLQGVLGRREVLWENLDTESQRRKEKREEEGREEEEEESREEAGKGNLKREEKEREIIKGA